MKLKYILFAFIAMYACFACSNEEDGLDGPNGGKGADGDSTLIDSTDVDGDIPEYSKNLILNYIKPYSLLIKSYISDDNSMWFSVFRNGMDYNKVSKELVYNPLLDETSEFYVFSNNNHYFVNGKVDLEMLKMYRDKMADLTEYSYDDLYWDYVKYYGDTTYNGRTYIFSRFRFVIRLPLESVDVITEDAYNDNYPPKSSLKDILEVRVCSAYDYIKSDYSLSDSMLLPTCKAKDITKENPKQLIESLNLCLSEQPSAGEHTLRFTFTFGEDPVSGETIDPIVSEVTFKVEEE